MDIDEKNINEILRGKIGGDKAHDTGVTSSCLDLLSENGVLEMFTTYEAMSDLTTQSAKLAQMVGYRSATYAHLATLFSLIQHLIEKGDEEFARAIMTDIHAVVAAEKWPIMSCVHIEQE